MRSKRYTPALDQVPMTSQDREIRRLQDLLLVCPSNKLVRELYYDALCVNKQDKAIRPTIQIIVEAISDYRRMLMYPSVPLSIKAYHRLSLRARVVYWWTWMRNGRPR